MRELARMEASPTIRETLAEVSVGLNMAKAVAAPKLYQVSRQLGEDTVVKLLIVILRAFVDSVKVPLKPDPSDLIELAAEWAETYTHDSLKDLILALREGRAAKLYQSLDISTIKLMVIHYFERKAAFLENRHLDQKATGASQQAQTVQLFGDAAPQMLEHVAQQIPADHPNAVALREKLSITNQKLRRKLITPAEAEQQRAEVRKALDRKPRADWKPSPEAQQQLDRKHDAENREILRRYQSR